MAPSHFPDTLHHDEESQVPPWVESFTPSTQVLPTFTVSELSQFSFKLPPQQTTSFVTEFIGLHDIPYIFLSPDSQPYLSIDEFLASPDQYWNLSGFVPNCYGIRAPTRHTLHSPFPRWRTLFLHRRIPHLTGPIPGPIHIRP